MSWTCKIYLFIYTALLLDCLTSLELHIIERANLFGEQQIKHTVRETHWEGVLPAMSTRQWTFNKGMQLRKQDSSYRGLLSLSLPLRFTLSSRTSRQRPILLDKGLIISLLKNKRVVPGRYRPLLCFQRHRSNTKSWMDCRIRPHECVLPGTKHLLLFLLISSSGASLPLANNVMWKNIGHGLYILKLTTFLFYVSRDRKSVV